MTNKPDPVLLGAVEEIRAICRKHDIGAYITLASKTHGEYAVQFPTWSKVQMEETPQGPALRFKAKGKEREANEATVHMLQVFQNVAKQVHDHIDRLLEMLESKWFITGGPKRI